MRYTWIMKRVCRSSKFIKWHKDLRDRRAVFKINTRIKRLAQGNPGDVKPVGEGISEMRIDYDLGYRIYYIERMVRDIGKEVIILLCGGDKTSQKSDIADAKKLARNLPEGLIED